MTDHQQEELEQRLIRLRDRTAALQPRPHFVDAVMAKVAESGHWLRGVLLLGRRAVSVAALLAVLAVAWAYSHARAADVKWAAPMDADADELLEMD